MKKTQRDICLTVGTLGMVWALFMVVMSVFALVKVSKLTIVLMMLASTYLFYEGLAPKVRTRMNQVIRSYWQEYREKGQQILVGIRQRVTY
ncbi:hypothetical protein [Pleionea sp. CnH1-48]|uniref:hypothetical protein n=1 Tax=Pleionea sp. CnH1-48 TaxID=2954494 RepID=UPI0020970C30|nr:hypothetical protein [Pleionea sp. CnH1-48]MCO7225088.1 hypothetical protein [Pleionea sp. CnH1-48]